MVFPGEPLKSGLTNLVQHNLRNGEQKDRGAKFACAAEEQTAVLCLARFCAKMDCISDQCACSDQNANFVLKGFRQNWPFQANFCERHVIHEKVLIILPIWIWVRHSVSMKLFNSLVKTTDEKTEHKQVIEHLLLSEDLLALVCGQEPPKLRLSAKKSYRSALYCHVRANEQLRWKCCAMIVRNHIPRPFYTQRQITSAGHFSSDVFCFEAQRLVRNFTGVVGLVRTTDTFVNSAVTERTFNWTLSSQLTLQTKAVCLHDIYVQLSGNESQFFQLFFSPMWMWTIFFYDRTTKLGGWIWTELMDPKSANLNPFGLLVSKWIEIVENGLWQSNIN